MSPPPTMLVFAHPDDETVGMGASLARLGVTWFVCVTDGAPRDLTDARRAGCNSRRAYARRRETELCAAVSRAGHSPERISFLGVADQEASLRLPDIARALDSLIGAVRPRLVITHPFEGGHPDHDATAFAVRAAIELRRGRGTATPALVEMTSYHSRRGEIEFGEFLPGHHNPVITLSLDATARERKRAMIACHASQSHVLQRVPLEHERFRRAPNYDFTQPPHRGLLFYEQFPWGMTGSRWRELAAAATAQLGLATSRDARAARERSPCASPS